MMPIKGFGVAVHEVSEYLISPRGLRLSSLSYEALAARIEHLGMTLRAHDIACDSERAHEAATELAAVTLFYMARSLS